MSSTRRIVFITIAVIVSIGLVGGSFVIWKHFKQASSPIPSDIVQAAEFSVYYPDPLPKGYSYKAESADYSQGTLIYTLKNATKEITITEQAVPEEQIQFQKIPGFRTVGNSPGEAVIGKLNGKPVVLLQTESTLINITGTSDVSPTTLSTLTQNMTSLSD